jgi:hypothetical protein
VNTRVGGRSLRVDKPVVLVGLSLAAALRVPILLVRGFRPLLLASKGE